MHGYKFLMAANGVTLNIWLVIKLIKNVFIDKL